ncbi:hypothetical protein GCM10023079_36820 [Streptomyces chitinivorans]
MRCDLAAALLHDPPVVFPDEPTIGMDVVVKEQVRGRFGGTRQVHATLDPAEPEGAPSP